MLTKEQRSVVEELLARMNARRREKKYAPVSINKLPSLPGKDPSSFYLVDTYQVRRHWRRRPVRK